MPELIVAPHGEVGEVSVVNPTTGELVDLRNAEPDEIAAALEGIRDWENSARTAKQLISAEIHARMDRSASWTLRAGDYELRGQSPDRSGWDVNRLREVLYDLVGTGAITPEAADEAVKAEVKYSVSKRGLNALLKLGGDIAAALRACEVEDTRPRRLTLSRKA
jgi:hypothetical protein